MARYIDADALIKKIFPYYNLVDKKSYSINAKAVYEEIKKAPTADVVPKSEVEQLQHKYDLAVEEREANVKGFVEYLSKVKSEVASEIFAEIEFDIHQLDFDQEETRAIAIEGIIAAVKRKYTEGEVDERRDQKSND